jgi:uncharacterized protein (TIGR02678 family)
MPVPPAGTPGDRPVERAADAVYAAVPATPADSAVAAIAAAERRRAVRLLLASPLATDLHPDPAGFALVRRHAAELQRWFAERLGYRLVVETEFARLHKRSAPGARPRPLRTASRPFDARRYALLCLTLAALERVEVQTVLSELAEQVKLLADPAERVSPLDLQSHAERQAFVDAVRWLVGLGVLSLTDGEDTSFVEGRGDALYDVHNRPLAQMLSATVPATAAELLAGGSEREIYPDTEEGANRRLRHRLMRRLAEEPVLYLDELTDGERSYLATQRPFLIEHLAAGIGLEVEMRQEGLLAIDPEDELSDLAFPATGTLSHAALLLAENLAGRARAAPQRQTVVPVAALQEVMRELAARHGHLWSRWVRDDPAGPEVLLREALERLEMMGLVESAAGGVRPLPAIARYRVAEPAAPAARNEDGVAGDGAEGGLGPA